MKALAFAIILLLLVGVVSLAVNTVLVNVKRRSLSRDPWEDREISENDCLNVYAVKPGQDPVYLGGVPWASEDFDGQIELVRSEADRRIVAANNGNPRALTRRELH